MVFTFEHVSLDSRPGGSGKFDLSTFLPVLKKNLNEWQWPSPKSAGTRCTGTTMINRGPCRGSRTMALSIE